MLLHGNDTFPWIQTCSLCCIAYSLFYVRVADYTAPILAIRLNAVANHTCHFCFVMYGFILGTHGSTEDEPLTTLMILLSMYFCFSMDHFPRFIRGRVQPSDGRAVFVPRSDCLRVFPTHSGVSRCTSESASSMRLVNYHLDHYPGAVLFSSLLRSVPRLTQTLNVLGDVERRLSCD